MSDSTRKPRVLIIDDDPDFVADLEVMLSSEFEVISSGDTREARDCWINFAPECVLLDLRLPRYFGDDPDWEGLSLIDHIKNNPAIKSAGNTPVIIVTAGSGKARIEKARELGISMFYRKPPDLKRLKTSIWGLIGKGTRAASGLGGGENS